MLNVSKIEYKLSALKITKAKLCSRLGIARSTLDSILNGSDAKISTIESIAKELGLSMGYLFDEESKENYEQHGDRSLMAKTIQHLDIDQRNISKEETVDEQVKVDKEIVLPLNCTNEKNQSVANLTSEITYLNRLIAEKDSRINEKDELISDLRERIKELKKQMKQIIVAILSAMWMSLISIGAAYIFIWLLPYCFYSSWWKVLVLALFGTALFVKIWNAIVPLMAVYPVVFVADKLKSWKPAMVGAAIPCVIFGLLCIFQFWSITKDISFDIKDWVSAIVWNSIVASSYYHLTLAFISIYNDEPDYSINRKDYKQLQQDVQTNDHMDFKIKLSFDYDYLIPEDFYKTLHYGKIGTHATHGFKQEYVNALFELSQNITSNRDNAISLMNYLYSKIYYPISETTKEELEHHVLKAISNVSNHDYKIRNILSKHPYVINYIFNLWLSQMLVHEEATKEIERIEQEQI